MKKLQSGIELSTFYRSQCLYEDKVVTTMPAHRVSLTKDLEIVFNPDNSKYVYFSPTKIHHNYYMIKKMVDTINDFLRKMNKESLCISERDFRNYEKIKKACVSLGNLKKEVRIESVSLDFLASVEKFVLECSIENRKKKEGQLIPERTDRRVCGGGLGLAEDWLELLKLTTLYSRRKVFQLEDFLDFVLEKKNKKLSRIQACDLYELKNPRVCLVKHIVGKDSINQIYRAIDNIYENQEYNETNEVLTKAYFEQERKLLKKERGEAVKQIQSFL